MKQFDLTCERFPRSSAYHPDWVLAGISGGANPLWLAEWLTEVVELRPGMRVLDLGSGQALSSVFLCREFGVQVWAVDLWHRPTEIVQRLQDAGVANAVFPLRVDARSLPFPDDYFDAIVSIDAFMYFGTDDLYLNYLARFLKPEGQLGIALAGFVQEIESSIPEHLADWWAAERPSCLHSASWWQRHWERTGILSDIMADTLPEGWRYWRDWIQLVAPDNLLERTALEADAGRYFGYGRCVGRRRGATPLFDPHLSLAAHYVATPLLRTHPDRDMRNAT